MVPAAATQADAVPVLLTCLKATSDNQEVIVASLSVLQSLLGVDASKDAFMRAGGAILLQELLQTETGKPAMSRVEHVHRNAVDFLFHRAVPYCV